MNEKVSLICTTYNCKDELNAALKVFTTEKNLVLVEEISIVDGGSKDGTWELLQKWSKEIDKIKVCQIVGANISKGRNEAIKRTKSNIIVTFDSGTEYGDNWLKFILEPLLSKKTEIASGLTVCCGDSIFQKCLAALGDRHRASIKPSHRGVAYYRYVWEEIGGYPEYVQAGEDTWFNTQCEKKGYKHVNVSEAKNYWKVRNSWKKVFKMQYRNIKGQVILAEPSGIVINFGITSVYLVIIILLLLGFIFPVLFLMAAIFSFMYFFKRLFGKRRWRFFVNPLHFIVGLYVLNGWDMGNCIGTIEGLFILIHTKFKKKIYGNSF
ncbi:MAG: hypothetical protein A2Y10_07015 [Planctomycetes bacterium GWF2_41_51]|nr:MAG: hypothetical protein A2Y10_07015 [Planctomycetes bacterium GWF2_41_51]HBG28785.1 hypothetical protein [Phycisphaerales bacterium]